MLPTNFSRRNVVYVDFGLDWMNEGILIHKPSGTKAFNKMKTQILGENKFGIFFLGSLSPD